MYTDRDARRRLAEPAKGAALPGTEADHRGAFARDRARVLHSAALRRLAGKTQVVGPDEEPGNVPVPRTRLTHSLEVAQIGRELAAALGADPDVVDTAALAHDIGHPPFGHNGEQALDEVAACCGGFEGNAQTLRTLTRLEPKVLGPDGRGYGLNLTRACLDATVKYPWPRAAGAAEPAAGSGRKFGVYADDMPAFEWVREAAPDARPCLEAQLMDWADDVAYSVHDVEDAVLTHRVSLAVLADPEDRADLARIAADHYTTHDVATVEAAAAELLRLPVVAELAGSGYDGTLRAQIALKRLTSELVGRFVTAAGTDVADAGAPPRYARRLRVPGSVRAEVALLKAVAMRYVMRDPRRRRAQRGQRELLAELVDALRNDPERTALDPERTALDPLHAAALHRAGDERDRTRVVIDQVASLTDAQAHAWHRALCR